MHFLQSDTLKNIVKLGSKKALLWRYHRNQYSFVKKRIKAVLTETRPLGETEKQLCDAYAQEVLGWRGYAPWLYLYSLRSGGFKEGWIPENYFYTEVMPRVQVGYGEVSNLRCLTHKIFQADVHPDLAYCINGNWYLPGGIPVSEPDLFAQLSKEEERLVYKLDNSYQGQGIFVVRTTELQLATMAVKGNGVLQRYIDQHTFFKQFTSASVACIRLNTVIALDGTPELRGAFLRLGQAKDTHVQYFTEIAVAINLTTGVLDATGYHPNWTSCRQHPDHNISFEGLEVPSFQDAVKTVLALHSQIPMVGMIGWDVIVNDKNRVVLMEWNGYGSDVAFSEITQGPCFTGLGWEHFHKKAK